MKYHDECKSCYPNDSCNYICPSYICAVPGQATVQVGNNVSFSSSDDSVLITVTPGDTPGAADVDLVARSVTGPTGARILPQPQKTQAFQRIKFSSIIAHPPHLVK